MTDPIVPRHRVPLSPQSAFVVHLTPMDGEKSETLLGRVEHVSSGRSSHFVSSDELVRFMRHTLAKRGKVSALLLCLLLAAAAQPSTAAALCCQRPSGACADKPIGLVACVLARGSLRLDEVCTPAGCRPPTPPAAGCCSLSRFKCAAAGSQSECSRRGGTFLPGRACTIIGCLPIATPTYTRSPTRSATPTATRTPSPNPTQTASPTTTRTDSRTPTKTATATPTDSPTPTSSPTTTPCEDGPPIPLVVVDEGQDAEEDVILPPQSDLTGCPDQSLSGGGCPLLNTMDGSIVNTFDASDSIDPRACASEPAALSYRWEILFPPTLLNAPYVAKGITGYLTPTLTILPSSLPGLENTEAGEDTFWRARLTVTEQPKAGDSTPAQKTVVVFRFKYQQTELTLQMSTDCQRIGHLDGTLCTIDAALPPTEPTP